MPAFRDIARYAAKDCLLKPLLLEYMNRDIDMAIRVVNVHNRPPDGWFHSSAHPALGVPELQAYLAGQHERRGETGYGLRMSMLVGSFMHEVVREALNDLKVMVPLRAYCQACQAPRAETGCREHGAADERTRSRGHLDAIVDLGCGIRGHPGAYGVDLKTIRTFGLKDAPDMDTEYFRAAWPKYWYQMQDYMRMSGLRQFIVLFMAMGSPWEMREYHLDYDVRTALEIESKYLQALAARE
jgi:hypothetical protein